MKDQPQPVQIVMVANASPVITTVDDFLYRFRRTPVRAALERYGVPLGLQPIAGEDCVRLLTERMDSSGLFN